MTRLCPSIVFGSVVLQSLSPSIAAPPALAEYFSRQVSASAANDPCAIKSADEWPARRETLRRQLQGMMGLDPYPARGDLHATVTGTIDRAGIVVEKLHFQSSPGLYVTANFYRPAEVQGRLPTILYLCGHSRVVEEGVSLGNKVGYQHHGAWFARNGYCCLLIDTLQLGEIEGIHRGTSREGMWWWVSRGYTPAGVEAWNAIRALDYLETRPEVDRQRLGVTGRSGGGAYSWWLAALDDRPACFVPVAGITDLQNHVVDGCIKGHCDCMFMVNRLAWDFDTVACLVAPRPCLLENTDRDPLFPLDGVVRIHKRMADLYRQLGAEEKLGLTICEGGHKDTQELQLAALRWFNRWLRNTDEPVANVAEKLFAPRELKVFETLPTDAVNRRIHETFVAAAPAVDPPSNYDAWQALRSKWLDALRARVFTGWPSEDITLAEELVAGSAGDGPKTFAFTSEPGVRLKLEVAGATGRDTAVPIVLHIVGDGGKTYLDRKPTSVLGGATWAFLAPRGCDVDWTAMEPKLRVDFARRFILVGTTVDEGRVWDIRRAVELLRKQYGEKRAIVIAARGISAGWAVYASLFCDDVSELLLAELPESHKKGPTFINVLKVLDMPQAVSMTFPRRVHLSGVDPIQWDWAECISRLYAEDPQLLTIDSPRPAAGR